MRRRLWGWLPVPVRCVASLPARADGSIPAGRCVATWLGPVIEIRAAYRDDAGLLAHERRHAEQWWATAAVAAGLALLSLAVLAWRAEAWRPVIAGAAPPLAAAAGLLAFRVLYAGSAAWRLRCEAAAYAVQLTQAAPVQQPRRRAQYVDFMGRWYRLDRYPAERIAAALDAAVARQEG